MTRDASLHYGIPRRFNGNRFRGISEVPGLIAVFRQSLWGANEDPLMGKRSSARFLVVVFGVTSLFLLFHGNVAAEDDKRGLGQTPAPEQQAQRPTLVQAAICEKVENLNPVTQSMVFPVSAGQVCCFTSFDPVPQASVIFHRWFHRDELSTQIRLRIYPPKWSTYSVIQLRETDKGPWRVEIADQSGTVYEVLRFSITD